MTFGSEIQVTHHALTEGEVIECRAEDVAAVAKDAANSSGGVVMIDALGVHRERGTADGASVALGGEHGLGLLPGHPIAADEVVPASGLSVMGLAAGPSHLIGARLAPGVQSERPGSLAVELREAPNDLASSTRPLGNHVGSLPPAEPRQFVYGELFAGVSGFGQGFERAGARCAWRCEIDRQAQDVLRFHYPDDPLWADVTTFDPDAFECPDVVLFGSPCQDLSVAGKRAGLEGSRSVLFHEAIRIVRGFAQRGMRWAVWENVPGALSSNNGSDFAEVLASFLDAGALDVGWAVLDSQWFGVPQRRRRVFVVADFRGRCAGEVLALAQGLRGDSPPSRTTGKVAPTLSSIGAGVGRTGNERTEADFLIASARETGAGFWTDDGLASLRAQPGGMPENMVAMALTANMQRLAATVETFIPHTAHTLRADGFDASEDGTGRGAPLVPVYPIDAQACRPGEAKTPSVSSSGKLTLRDPGLGIGNEGDPCPTLQTGAVHSVAFSNRGKDGPAFEALPAGPHGALPMVGTGMAVRRLTPRECERLQGWTDDHTRYGRKEDGTVYEQADGPRYKQCGNGVTANVSEWIARNLIAQELKG